MGAKHRARFQPSGVIQDIPPEAVPPENWTRGDNVNFRDGVTSRVLGWAAVLGTPITDIWNLLYAPDNQVPNWFYMGSAAITGTDGAAHIDITPVLWTPSVILNSMTSTVLNTIPIFNNNLDVPVYAPAGITSQCLPLPDWPPEAQAYAMRPYRNFLIAMNISTQFGQDVDLIQWSDAAAAGQVPQEWTPSENNQAGNNVIGDVPGAIIDGRALRSDFIIYKNNSTHIMSLVGGLAVMSFRTLFTNTGVLARNCIISAKGNHYVLTDGDVIVHDGQNQKSIIDEKNRTFLFSLIDKDSAHLAFAVYHDAASEIWFCVPSLGSDRADVAAVYALEDDGWSFRELPDILTAAHGSVADSVGAGKSWEDTTETWNEIQITWNQIDLSTLGEALVMGSPDVPALFEADTDVTADGVTINAVVSNDSKDLGSPHVIKIVRRIWPRITANPGAIINVRVGTQIQSTDPIAFGPSIPFTVGSSLSADTLQTGRLISVEFSSNEDQLWRLTSYDVEYQDRGEF